MFTTSKIQANGRGYRAPGTFYQTTRSKKRLTAGWRDKGSVERELSLHWEPNRLEQCSGYLGKVTHEAVAPVLNPSKTAVLRVVKVSKKGDCDAR